MKVKAEELNINEEYEKLVPPTERKSLYDEEDEDYKSLREYIMAQPTIRLPNNPKLPFKDVKLLEYVEYRFNEFIEQATSEHKHLFFIKQSIKGKLEFCNAAGYYDKNENNFTLLPYSYIVNETHGVIPFKFTRDKSEKDGCNRYITFSVRFGSPEDAATFVLGQKVGLDEWVDRRGKGLLNYYPKLATYQNITIDDSDDSNVNTRKIFYINVSGRCRASGYFDSRSGNFYIMKNSLLTLNADPDFEKSALGIARNRMIVVNCTRNSDYYIVNKDTKCWSATAAASYVLGKDSSYIEWEDLEGKALKDFYPNRFYQKKEHSNNPIQIDEVIELYDAIHRFYIRRTNEHGCECDAIGHYDTVTKSFILEKDSVWAREVNYRYMFTASEIQRRQYIRKYCKLTANRLVQSKDISFNTPSTAASFVLGMTCADGWDVWRDKEGKSLREVYKLENKG